MLAPQIVPRHPRLNIGCGPDVRPGMVNLDAVPLPGVDVVADLNQPLPFPDASFEYVGAFHILEHLGSGFIPLLREVHRTLKPGGVFHVRVPYYRFEGAFTDPTHVRFFGIDTMDYFTNSHVHAYYTEFRFRILVKRLNRLPPRMNCRHFPRYHIRKYLGICWPGQHHEVEWVLAKDAPDTPPSPPLDRRAAQRLVASLTAEPFSPAPPSRGA